VVRTAAAVTGVRLCGRRVEAVEYRDANAARDRRVGCGSLISTIPIPDFVSAMGDAVPAAVAAAAAALRYKPIAVYGLLVAREKCLDGLYVYFRDRVFHRIGEPKNAGMIVDPADHTLLIVETTCEIGDARWRGDANAVAAVLSDLEAEGICRRSEIVETHLLTAEHAYPLYALGFEAHRDLVAGFIDSLENAQSTGRQGSFTYPNMHGAMRMGARAAARIAIESSPARCSEDAPHS